MDGVVATDPAPLIASAAPARRLAGRRADRIAARPGGAAMRGERTMKSIRVQIVGRIPAELSRRVRARAKRRKLTLNAFLIDALTHAVGGGRPARVSEPSR